MNIIFNNISTATDECILNFKYSLENKLHKCPQIKYMFKLHKSSLVILYNKLPLTRLMQHIYYYYTLIGTL